MTISYKEALCQMQKHNSVSLALVYTIDLKNNWTNINTLTSFMSEFSINVYLARWRRS